MRYLKQSTSVDVKIGPFLDETDGKTAETALTITQPDVRLAKNGGAWAQKAAAQTLSHEEAGWYEVTLDATDTDTVGHLIVAVHESGALPVWLEFTVLEEEVYDDLFAASAVGYLKPTTAGRDLDVTATGAAGIDFGNVENQSTSVNLSGTSVGTVAAVTAIDPDGITTTSLDATLRIRLGIVSYGVLDAGAAGGFTLPTGQRLNVAAGDMIHVPGKGARIIASGYNSTTGVGTTVSNFDSAAAASDPYVVIKLPRAEPLAAADFADNFLTSAKIAADAFDADALAADAVTEIQSGLATAAALATVDDFLDTEIAAIKTKTDFLPSATAGAAGGLFIAGSNAATTVNVTGNITGNLSGSVGSVTGAVGSVTAGVTLAASAVQAIWDALTSALTTANSIGKRLVDYLTGDIYARLGAPAGASTAADIAAIKAETASILTDTAEIGAAGAGLTALASAANLATLTAYVDTEVAAIKAKTDLLPASPAATGDAMTLTSGERAAIAAALLDLADGIETGMTPRQTLRLLAAGVGGKLSGGGTATEVFRNAVADAKARITATVDASGNRTAITYDLT